MTGKRRKLIVVIFLYRLTERRTLFHSQMLYDCVLTQGCLLIEMHSHLINDWSSATDCCKQGDAPKFNSIKPKPGSMVGFLLYLPADDKHHSLPSFGVCYSLRISISNSHLVFHRHGNNLKRSNPSMQDFFLVLILAFLHQNVARIFSFDFYLIKTFYHVVGFYDFLGNNHR